MTIPETVSPEGLRLRANAMRDKPMLNDNGSCARHLELAADRIEALEAECFALSAGVCQHKLGNEHGNPYCGKTNELI